MLLKFSGSDFCAIAREILEPGRLRRLEISFSPEGIYLPGLDLWLDNTGFQPHTWISHAHADHARGRHQTVIATPTTLAIAQARSGASLSAQRIPVAYGESIDYRGARLTAFPAAHILGAASLLVDFEGERLLYTGDIKRKSPLLGQASEIPACDHLIIESTFGLPIFRFLDQEEARRRIVAFAKDCLADGIAPVFIGYALGRGQEIVHALSDAGIPTAVHGAIARLIPFFESEGYQFQGWQPYLQAQQTGLAGHAIVVTNSFSNNLPTGFPEFRQAYVSGWASMDNARARSGAEELIPYSDHGGFDELLQIVAESGARHVDVVHGFTDPFARILRERGLDARAPFAAMARDEEPEPELGVT
jgi:Cft2 family RNA processing exonuclease